MGRLLQGLGAVEATADELDTAAADDIVLVDLTGDRLELADRCHLVVGVDCPAPVRIRRLAGLRGLTGSAATAWVMSGGSDTQHLAAADVVLDNAGSAQALATQVTALWRDRLDPFDDNLLLDRPAEHPQSDEHPQGDEHQQAPPTDPRRETHAARHLARLRRALAEQAEPAVTAIEVATEPTDPIHLEVAVATLDQVDTDQWRAALRTAGFVPLAPAPTEPGNHHERRFGSADPAAQVVVHVRAPEPPAAETPAAEPPADGADPASTAAAFTDTADPADPV